MGASGMFFAIFMIRNLWRAYWHLSTFFAIFADKNTILLIAVSGDL
jgi:hypothetical protein